MPKYIRHVGPKTGATQRVFLATPAYSGLSAAYTRSLFATYPALLDAGIEIELEILTENCHVDDSRNALVRSFLESECTDLFFLDADLSWRPSELVRLLQYDEAVVGGTYPLKHAEEGYPVRHIGNKIYPDDRGLIEVEGLPTGFLRIRRDVLELLDSISPKFSAKNDEPGRRLIPCIFERTMEGKTRWGGDYTFCRKCRKHAGSIYLDPETHHHHIGEQDWSGCYGDYVRRINGLAVPAFLEKIRAGETDIDWVELVRAWDNYPWSIGPSMAAACALIAADGEGPILEAGSGLSTLIVAAAAPKRHVVALEHDFGWAQKVRLAAFEAKLDNVEIIHAPLVRYGSRSWYDADRLPLCHPPFSMVIVDGPPRIRANDSARHLIFVQAAHTIAPDAIVVMDDAGDLTELEARLSTTFKKFALNKDKTFAIGRLNAAQQENTEHGRLSNQQTL